MIGIGPRMKDSKYYFPDKSKMILISQNLCANFFVAHLRSTVHLRDNSTRVVSDFGFNKRVFHRVDFTEVNRRF